MGNVFNLAQITKGKSLADWRPSNRDECTPALPDTAPATSEQSPDSEQETTTMGTRSDIRAALQSSPVSYAKLKERLKDKNIATTLSQLTKEGQITRTDKGGEAVYALGRAPGTKRESTAKPHKKGKRAQTAAPKRRGRPAKVHSSAGAPLPSTQIARTIAELRLHRDLVDIAINSLEQLGS